MDLPRYFPQIFPRRTNKTEVEDKKEWSDRLKFLFFHSLMLVYFSFFAVLTMEKLSVAISSDDRNMIGTTMMYSSRWKIQSNSYPQFSFFLANVVDKHNTPRYFWLPVSIVNDSLPKWFFSNFFKRTLFQINSEQERTRP